MTVDALQTCRRAAPWLAAFLLGAAATSAVTAQAPGAANPLTKVVSSDSGRLRLNITPATTPRVGDYSSWTVAVVDVDGKPTDALLGVRGGMPAHGHGLPSKPQLKRMGNGKFVLEGMFFNMPGAWVVVFDLRTSEGAPDSATHRFELKF